jgi:hypothetical protein
MFKKPRRASLAAGKIGDVISIGNNEMDGSSEGELRYDTDGDEGNAGSVEETARYIADMVGALAAMAGDAKLDLLTYLLNMARVEAELQARQSESADDDSDD